VNAGDGARKRPVPYKARAATAVGGLAEADQRIQVEMNCVTSNLLSTSAP
jgi:hypothetical protein